MANNYAKTISHQNTPQTQPLIGKNQTLNSAGGYVFAIDNFKRLERFITLGNEGGTFYASEKKLTIENANCTLAALNEDYVRTIDMIVDISFNGKAPKNDAAIFALALAACSKDTKVSQYALAQVNKVCRIPTHLFQFVEATNSLRGWWRGVRRAVNNWYDSKEVDQVIYQTTKYQNREGWTHRDLFRLTHIKATDEKRNAAYRHVVKGGGEEAFPYLKALENIKTADSKDVADAIRKYNIPRECVPTEKLNDVKIWEALLEKMPLNAMVRNLGKMSSIGLLTPLSKAEKLVSERLLDRENIKKSRLHPMSILLASTTYRSGHGLKGNLSWTPSNVVLNALDKAFYLAFDNVEKLDKRVLIALDISGSMGTKISGTHLSCRYASAALSIVMANSFEQYHVMGFSHQFIPLNISKNSTLADADRVISGLPFGSTDCSLPMIYAQKNNLDVDLFVVMTDNETYHGSKHPCVALKEYRKSSGINAKLAVLGMTATNFSIADPQDAGSLDLVGFSTDTPTVLHNFAKD